MDNPTAKSFIAIENLSKTFRENRSRLEVLKNITIGIPEGSFTTFLGPSGCGKTTLLRIISGLDKNFEGSVKINGNLVTKKDRKEFGFVFQESNLLPWKNAEENIDLFCALLGKKSDSTRLIEDVGLSGFEKYYPHELSGGMQKRAALARALAMEPKILFMDEPFGSLDEFTKQKMHFLLLELQRKFKITVIFVTHSIDEAILLSDTVITLSGKPTMIHSIYDAKDIRHGENKIKKNQEYLALSEKIYKDFNL